MNIALRRPMTLDQFLAWEERQELRYEFDGFQPLAMTGGTVEHSGIQSNLITALTNRLRGKPCRPHGSHLKIQVAGRIRYPDAFVVCTPTLPGAQVVTDPVVIFEILSNSTASSDLVVKNAEYRETPSVKRYVILQQTSAAAIVFSHRAGEWATDIVVGTDAVISLPEIGIELPLEEIYGDIVLPTETDDSPE